jgi:hypothetical protein
MNRATIHEETEAAILLRMARSRAALLATNRRAPALPTAPGQTGRAAASVIAALKDAPRVTLILALCVSAIVLGPRRTVGIASRSGVAAWVGGSVRKLIHTAVSADRG